MTSRPALLQLKDRVDQALGWAVTAIMALAVVNVLWQVFTRYVLESPSAYTDELARYLLIWIGLLGASYAAGQRLHLAIDLLPARLTGTAKAALGLVIDTLIFLFALLVMVFGGLRLMALTMMLEQTSAALGLSLGYIYMVVPISGLFIMFYSILFMTDHVRGLRGKHPILEETDEQSASAYGREVHTVGGGREAGADHQSREA